MTGRRALQSLSTVPRLTLRPSVRSCGSSSRSAKLPRHCRTVRTYWSLGHTVQDLKPFVSVCEGDEVSRPFESRCTASPVPPTRYAPEGMISTILSQASRVAGSNTLAISAGGKRVSVDQSQGEIALPRRQPAPSERDLLQFMVRGASR